MNHLLQRQGSHRIEGEKPFVSVVCPSYNRREFLPYLLYIYQYQDYPADRRELIIVDDSPHSSQDLVDMLVDPSMENVRYIHSDRRLMLGEKRNMLNDLAKGEYIVCFDDDDYYSPQKSLIRWMNCSVTTRCFQVPIRSTFGTAISIKSIALILLGQIMRSMVRLPITKSF